MLVLSSSDWRNKTVKASRSGVWHFARLSIFTDFKFKFTVRNVGCITAYSRFEIRFWKGQEAVAEFFALLHCNYRGLVFSFEQEGGNIKNHVPNSICEINFYTDQKFQWYQFEPVTEMWSWVNWLNAWTEKYRWMGSWNAAPCLFRRADQSKLCK